MGLIWQDSKQNLDEKKFRQILAEEALEEEQFNRHQSFDTPKKNVEKKVEKKVVKTEKVVTKKVKEDVDYDNYYDDYASFNSIREDYDDEEEAYDDSIVIDDEYEDADTGYDFDSGLITSIVSNIFKWFFIVACILTAILVLYFILKAKFIAVFLYIISLACAFMFGYILMFVVNYFFFKD